MFLKGSKTSATPNIGEIDEYAGIVIEWKRGRKAILTIFDDDGKELEEVKLYELETRAEMHQLMASKGFLKKTKAQKVAEIQQAWTENQLRAIEQPTAIYDTVSNLYRFVFGAIAGEYCTILYRV